MVRNSLFKVLTLKSGYFKNNRVGKRKVGLISAVKRFHDKKLASNFFEENI